MIACNWYRHRLYFMATCLSMVVSLVLILISSIFFHIVNGCFIAWLIWRLCLCVSWNILRFGCRRHCCLRIAHLFNLLVILICCFGCVFALWIMLIIWIDFNMIKLCLLCRIWPTFKTIWSYVAWWIFINIKWSGSSSRSFH